MDLATGKKELVIWTREVLVEQWREKPDWNVFWQGESNIDRFKKNFFLIIISYRYITQWLDIFIHYEMTIPTRSVTVTKLLQYYWLYSLCIHYNPQLINFIVRSLYLLIPFIYFFHPPIPLPSSNYQFIIYIYKSMFFVCCFSDSTYMCNHRYLSSDLFH